MAETIYTLGFAQIHLIKYSSDIETKELTKITDEDFYDIEETLEYLNNRFPFLPENIEDFIFDSEYGIMYKTSAIDVLDMDGKVSKLFDLEKYSNDDLEEFEVSFNIEVFAEQEKHNLDYYEAKQLGFIDFY